MTHGVPFDVAFSLPPDEVLAWWIIIGQQEGGEWDWNAMQWKVADK